MYTTRESVISDDALGYNCNFCMQLSEQVQTFETVQCYDRCAQNIF